MARASRQHSQKMQEYQVTHTHLDREHVHADEIRGKGHRMIPWMASIVSTWVWLGGVGSAHRDRALADRLVRMGNACGQPWCALLV